MKLTELDKKGIAFVAKFGYVPTEELWNNFKIGASKLRTWEKYGLTKKEGGSVYLVNKGKNWCRNNGVNIYAKGSVRHDRALVEKAVEIKKIEEEKGNVVTFKTGREVYLEHKREFMEKGVVSAHGAPDVYVQVTNASTHTVTLTGIEIITDNYGKAQIAEKIQYEEKTEITTEYVRC